MQVYGGEMVSLDVLSLFVSVRDAASSDALYFLIQYDKIAYSSELEQRTCQ